MQRHRRLWVALAGLGLFAVLLAGAFSTYSLQARAASDPQDGGPDLGVVEHYFTILNAGMISGNFDALHQVDAPDATLFKSNPGSGTTHIYTGIDNIIAWYQVFQSAHPGLQFAEEETNEIPQPRRVLAPHVVLSYEDAPAGAANPGDCMHVFTLKGGMIQTLDWVTFNAGTP